MPLHVETFGDKVRTMNQTNSKSLTLSAADARNLHSDIASLMAKIVEMTMQQNNEATITSATMDGGVFQR